MKLVSMKTDDEGPQIETNMTYGYGTRLHLNDDQCEALGLKTPPQAGEVVMIHAQATIVRSSGSVEMDGDDTGTDVCMELQITDMAIERAGQLKDAAEKLYKGD